VRRDYLFYVCRREDGIHKEQSASEATEQAGVKECKLLTTLLPEGLVIFLNFWPSCPPVFLEDQQKVNRKVSLRSLRLERSGR
jgi:hypothetical protein